MQLKTSLPLLVVIFSVSVHSSGYFPSVGGPWNRYTTTTPAPTGEGFNLPATEAPPPPAVTFVPGRPTLPNQQPAAAGQGQNGNSNQNGNQFLIVTDPVTGERFMVYKQNFWDRFGSGAGNANVQAGQGPVSKTPFQDSRDRYDMMEEGYNMEANGEEEDIAFVPQAASRAKRSTNTDSDSSEELRHIDALADDSAEDKELSVGLLEENENPGRRPIMFQNLNAIDSEEDVGMNFKSSADLFKMFFPTMKFDTGKKMIYTYTQYRPISDVSTTSTTTSTTTPIPSSSTTEEVEVDNTTLPSVENTTTLTDFPNLGGEDTEIPQTTTIETPHEDVSPVPSK